MITLSGFAWRIICAIAALSGPDSTQHMQPPASCFTTADPSGQLASIATASKPTAPNSLTMMHHTLLGGLFCEAVQNVGVVVVWKGS
jgi:hypothetical protein